MGGVGGACHARPPHSTHRPTHSHPPLTTADICSTAPLLPMPSSPIPPVPPLPVTTPDLAAPPTMEAATAGAAVEIAAQALPRANNLRRPSSGPPSAHTQFTAPRALQLAPPPTPGPPNKLPAAVAAQLASPLPQPGSPEFMTLYLKMLEMGLLPPGASPATSSPSGSSTASALPVVACPTPPVLVPTSVPSSSATTPPTTKPKRKRPSTGRKRGRPKKQRQTELPAQPGDNVFPLQSSIEQAVSNIASDLIAADPADNTDPEPSETESGAESSDSQSKCDDEKKGGVVWEDVELESMPGDASVKD